MPDPSTFSLHEITALILAVAALVGAVLNGSAKVLRERRLARKVPTRQGMPPPPKRA